VLWFLTEGHLRPAL